MERAPNRTSLSHDTDKPRQRPLPALAAVRAFEAAARLGSFSRAAEELNMTPAAVSYQIKNLETRLGSTLFQRLPRKVLLTPAGAELAPVVGDAFGLLQDAFSALLDRTENELAIAADPAMATGWIAPRLGKFARIQSGLNLRLDMITQSGEPAFDACDVQIRNGDGGGQWPAVESHLLFPELYSPLMSPKLADNQGGLKSPFDLGRLPLLGPEKLWQMWFDHMKCGIDRPPANHRLNFGAEHLDVAAAIAGQGVAMASPILFAHELESRRLVQPFAETIETGGRYWLTYPAAHKQRPKIRIFARWLAEEAQRALFEHDVRSHGADSALCKSSCQPVTLTKRCSIAA